MSLREAAEQAATDLEELIHWHGIRSSDDKLMPAHNQTPEIKSAMESFEALREALAQPDEVLAEREACALICENMERNGAWITKAEAASAIRARGET